MYTLLEMTFVNNRMTIQGTFLKHGTDIGPHVLSFVNMHFKPTSKSSVPLKTSTLIFTRQNKVKVLREMWC